jgi:hypothetical protein
MKSVCRCSTLLVFLALALFPTKAFAGAVCTVGPSCPGFSATPLPFIPPVFEGQTMPLPAPVTAGDVVVYDDPQMTIISDVLRFIPGAGGMATSYILYSDPPDPEDLGIPLLLANQFLMVETAPLTYTAGPNTYPINSDIETGPPDVPEPSSMTLAAIGFGLMLGWAAAFLSRSPKL